MVKVIPLRYGTIFKRIFSQPKVFQAFAEDVLGLKLNITKVHTEYEYPKPIGFVKTAYAEDEEQRVTVEIQHVKEGDFFDRFLYYHLISLAEQVKSYQDYSFAHAVYTIVVLTSVPRDGTINFSHGVSDMSPRTEFGNRVAVYPHRLIFLVPRLVNEQTPPAIREWLELILDSLDEEVQESAHPRPLFQEMIAAMRQTTISPEMLAEIKDDAAWERAKTRFRREGHASGLEEGDRKRAIETARRMLQKGFEPTVVAEMTDLPVAEVNQVLGK
ncbi:Rpn family recombination-promoting nuclease/putative transposase [Anaerolineales bacterium HSG24]|nr:Rpn family recombination-promoting nuclease/putative transposase [Anaerolineales bacterium HSG24]